MVDVPVSALRSAAVRLAAAARFDDATALLDVAEPAPDEEVVLLLARAEVVNRRDRARGVRSGPDHPLVAGPRVEAGPLDAWDLAMLDLRRAYADALVESPDRAVVTALETGAARLLDSAQDASRRGWALMCRGWLGENLRGDRTDAPAHYAGALTEARAAGDAELVYEALRHLGDLAHDAGDHAGAQAAWEESAEAAARAGYLPGVLAQQLLLAVLARDRGHEAAAVALATEVGRWAGATGVRRVAAQAEAFLAGVDPTAPPPETTVPHPGTAGRRDDGSERDPLP